MTDQTTHPMVEQRQYSPNELAAILHGHATNLHMEGVPRLANVFEQAASALTSLSTAGLEKCPSCGKQLTVHEIGSGASCDNGCEMHFDDGDGWNRRAALSRPSTDLMDVGIPPAFYVWLARIERDVLAHELTPSEIRGLIAALTAKPDDALRPAPLAVPDGLVERAGWLIEHEDEPKWLTLRPAAFEVYWTKESTEALRFARRVDAEDYVAAFMDEGPIRITEHVWLVYAAKNRAEGK